jgi:hypothetical protein
MNIVSKYFNSSTLSQEILSIFICDLVLHPDLETWTITSYKGKIPYTLVVKTGYKN